MRLFSVKCFSGEGEKPFARVIEKLWLQFLPFDCLAFEIWQIDKASSRFDQCPRKRLKSSLFDSIKWLDLIFLIKQEKIDLQRGLKCLGSLSGKQRNDEAHVIDTAFSYMSINDLLFTQPDIVLECGWSKHFNSFLLKRRLCNFFFSLVRRNNQQSLIKLTETIFLLFLSHRRLVWCVRMNLFAMFLCGAFRQCRSKLDSRRRLIIKTLLNRFIDQHTSWRAREGRAIK